MIRAALLACLIVGGCSSQAEPGGGGGEAKAFGDWHVAKAKVDLAVAEAINAPGGGDYARAVAIVRAAEMSAAIKDFEVGQLVVGAYQGQVALRPTEGLAAGLALLEKAAVTPGETATVAPQQLRLIFERGVGAAPAGIAVDPAIAECWHKLENHGAGDPATCVALRQQRMPGLSRP